MANIDWEKERERLAELYARLEDSELEKIGAKPETLTDAARQIMGAEMSKRGMKLPEIAPPPIEPPTPVMIRRYRDLPAASVAQSILESAGIQSFLADENLVRLDWFYSNAVGGTKLLVREEEADEARKILGQEVPESFDAEGTGYYEQPKCPLCGSFEVSLDGLDKPMSYGGTWLLGIPMQVTIKGWKCAACGHQWKEEDAPESV